MVSARCGVAFGPRCPDGTGHEAGNEAGYIVGFHECTWGAADAPIYPRGYEMRVIAVYDATAYISGAMAQMQMDGHVLDTGAASQRAAYQRATAAASPSSRARPRTRHDAPSTAQSTARALPARLPASSPLEHDYEAGSPRHRTFDEADSPRHRTFDEAAGSPRYRTFVVRSAPIDLLYGEVYDKTQAPLTLPDDVIARYADGARDMAIESFALDLVDGDGVSVPLYRTYVHHCMIHTPSPTASTPRRPSAPHTLHTRPHTRVLTVRTVRALSHAGPRLAPSRGAQTRSRSTRRSACPTPSPARPALATARAPSSARRRTN